MIWTCKYKISFKQKKKKLLIFKTSKFYFTNFFPEKLNEYHFFLKDNNKHIVQTYKGNNIRKNLMKYDLNAWTA